MIRLKRLYAVLTIYNGANNDFPPANRWCDALLPYTKSKEDYFCYDPDNDAHMFALNPNATPKSEDDVVLLFESKGPWNAHGQSELLYIRDFKGETGCFILFCSGKIEFVQEDLLVKLRWQ